MLHTTPGNKNAFKALVAAEYCGVKVEVTKDFQMNVTNKTPEFIKMNPLGKVYEYKQHLKVSLLFMQDLYFT